MNHIGPYTIIDRIASGGMGEIYLAKLQREAGFEKLVAVKRILPHLAHDPGFVRMFEAEARLSALLTHRNIVQIHDFGRTDSDTYLAMEFVDGFNLRTLQDLGRESNQCLSLALSLRVAASAARALDYAYRREDADGQMMKIIHRDISPQNILVSVEGEVKVADFGLAKALQMDATSMAGELKGKLTYMSPEQVRGDALDTRADIFSLGAVLYELLSRQRLYPSKMPMRDLLGKVETADYLPLGQVAPDIPEPVQRVVARCVEPQREGRYTTARELVQDLDEVVSELGLSEPTYKLADHVRSFDRHRPLAQIMAKDQTLVPQRPIVSRDDSALVASDIGDGPTPTAETMAALLRPNADASRSVVSRVRTETVRHRESGKPLLLGLAILLLVVVGIVLWIQLFSPNDSDPTAPFTGESMGQAPHESHVPPGQVGAATAADASTTTAPTTRLVLTGTPTGAKCFAWDKLRDVQLDSQDCGEGWAVSPGPHTVVVTADTYLDWRKDVEVKEGERLEVPVGLEAKPIRPCELRVDTIPSGARVLVDGVAVAQPSPVQLAPLAAGAHTLELMLPGHRPVTRQLVCDRSTAPSLSVTLSPLEIVVSIRGTKRTLRPGGVWTHATKVGKVRVSFRVTAKAKAIVVTISTNPYAEIVMGGRPLKTNPTKFRVPLGASRRLRFLREGQRVGGLTLHASLPTQADVR